MKTPLPEKLYVTDQADFLQNIDYTAITINEIITYLAELTEVVNKQEEHITQMRNDWSEAEKDNPAFAPMPTLKEQLLGEIKDTKWVVKKLKRNVLWQDNSMGLLENHLTNLVDQALTSLTEVHKVEVEEERLKTLKWVQNKFNNYGLTSTIDLVGREIRAIEKFNIEVK